MSDTEIVLFPGTDGDENGNGWLPSHFVHMMRPLPSPRKEHD
jgi:hypothetical protein